MTVRIDVFSRAARPCQRCIRKGLADQCVDGYRKKAKYLLEEDEMRMFLETDGQPPVYRTL